jgi:hypothetical protein
LYWKAEFCTPQNPAVAALVLIASCAAWGFWASEAPAKLAVLGFKAYPARLLTIVLVTVVKVEGITVVYEVLITLTTDILLWLNVVKMLSVELVVAEKQVFITWRNLISLYDDKVCRLLGVAV